MAAAKKKVVERMHHQLFHEESRAYGLVRAWRVWMDVIDGDKVHHAIGKVNELL
jgi:hypothetical protein